MKRKNIVRNGVIIYRPRKKQLRELSLDDFQRELSKEKHTFDLRKTKEV